ncbi:MAG: flagellar protein FliT [Azoarcus sp.]|jgi:flagellar protein FliT|nr:flagellar protein FliT [Azoarcus sp.]
MIEQKQNTGTRLLNIQEARALLTLYETMVETARARDWERLSEIEHQAATIRDAALAPARGAAEPEPPVLENIEALTDLVTRILALDREIRSYVEPAREEARQQLAVEVKGRGMRAAYGSLDSPG